MSNPSLILPQSPAYGEDYVYAAQVEDGVVPLYNVLPLTFTRASGGTRINKDGLVQNMPYNLLQYSETFDNGYWNKYQSSISSNVIANPINGQTTADQLTYTTTGTAVLYTTSTALQNQVYALSCYGKKGSANILQIGFTLSGGDKIANYNLNTGVITTTSSGVTASIESIGNGWYRCTMSLTPDLNNPNVFINSTSATTGDYLYIYGAQVNIGSTAQPYLATTDRLNMPRITYPVGGGCGALLLEKQSTNDFIQSENLFTTHLVQNLTTSGNIDVAISPDGTQDADKFVPNATSGVHGIANGSNLAITSGQAYTFSAFVKSDGGAYNLISLTFDSTTAWGATKNCIFNASTGTSYSVPSGATMSSQNMGNGWYRITATLTASGSVSASLYQYRIYIADSSGNLSFSASSGNTAGIYVWGAQLEASSYATSYIPTTSTSATRIADVCYKTGISNLIGQTEGTILLDWKQNQFDILQGIYANNYNLTGSISIQIATNGTLQAYVCYAGTYFAISTSVNAIQIGQRYKVGFAYKSGNCALYLNGNLIGTNTTSFAFTTTLDEIDFSNRTIFFANSSEISVNEFYQYKTRLTNAELATLTTI